MENRDLYDIFKQYQGFCRLCNSAVYITVDHCRPIGTLKRGQSGQETTAGVGWEL